MRHAALAVVLVSTLLALSSDRIAEAQQSSFQIAPPPIAHPYFEAGRSDGKFNANFINIESATADISLSGPGLDVVGRRAFSEFMAVDFQGGLFALSGTMPGIPPIALIPAYNTSGQFVNYYGVQPAGDADVTMAAFSMSFNLEFQALKSDFGSLILFAGPNLSLINMTMTTPYNLIVPTGFTNAGEVRTGYTNELTVTATTAGMQVGMQMGFNLGSGIQLSPFFMMSSSSGTSTTTQDPGLQGVSDSTMTGDIPTTSTTSFGMDIIIGELSIGTLLQDIKSEENQNEDVKVTIFRLGYHF